MTPEERLELIKRNTLEVVTEDELLEKLRSGERLKGYIGYEPSGLPHVGWLVWMFKVRDLVDAGVDFIILEATWHAFINDKLGGDMELIRASSRVIRKAMEGLGLPVEKIRFVDAEELVSDKDYWGLLLRVAKKNSLHRIKRALTIMGKKAEDAELDSSKMIYPLMQVTDIFYMDLDIALGGMDQRKAHMLARDTAEKLGVKKPIAIHTPLVTGLRGVQRMDVARMGEIDEVYADVKMSKRSPDNIIFLHDPPEAIEAKIRRAYCPAGQVEFNPVVEIAKYILFAQPGFKLVVERPEKYGGTVVYERYSDLERDFVEKRLHPLDLKKAVARELARLLEPVRNAMLGDPGIARDVKRIEEYFFSKSG